MSNSNLVRWSGLPAMMSGVLLIAVVVLDLFTIDFTNLGEEANTVAFRFYAVLSLIAAMLLLMGLVGLYFHQSKQAGPLGLIGFLVSFIGTALIVGSFWAQTFGAPTLAERAPQTLNEAPTGWLGTGLTLSILVFALGWSLFGVAMLLARVFHPAAAALIVVGAMLSFIPLPYTEPVFATAVIWMGILLLREGGAADE